jgi:hypothetical protein
VLIKHISKRVHKNKALECQWVARNPPLNSRKIQGAMHHHATSSCMCVHLASEVEHLYRMDAGLKRGTYKRVYTLSRLQGYFEIEGKPRIRP